MARSSRQFGKWNSVYQQFRRWTEAGLWDLILETLNESGLVEEDVQMIDSTIIRAHHCAAGAKGNQNQQLAAPKAVSPPKSIYEPTAAAFR